MEELPAGTKCEFGERGYAIEVVDGALSGKGGELALGPLDWSLSGEESFVWTGDTNAYGLGPIDIFMLDLDGDAVADFKVSQHKGENLCVGYMALVRASGPWEWRPVGPARENCI
ncbi:hypothetical protein [Enhygromyxa salina]|uniref:hypothetical protein n=1 Tax=Enhygromyxa salina TaxID=215803 RepID=UPI0011B23398|nr:hypothetical protein [Enhygromyxa salina]